MFVLNTKTPEIVCFVILHLLLTMRTRTGPLPPPLNPRAFGSGGIVNTDMAEEHGERCHGW